MNLVQLSEQLKDVPDNFLMTEVQNPTGAYPAYLIVSEMTRRKRMRENAPKQEPQTTVAEDLMSGGIRAMQPQMPQQMPQQPGAAQAMASQMPMPQMPQSPQEPQMMAAGGLVAFEQGGPIRGQAGLLADLRRYVLPYEDEERRAALDESVSEIGPYILGATSDIPFPRFTPLGADPESSPLGNLIRGRLSPTEDAAYVPPSNYAPPSKEPVISLQSLGVGKKKSETDIMLEMMAQQQAERDRQASKTGSPVATGAPPKGAGASKVTAPPPQTGPSTAAEAMRLATEITTARPPTYDREAEIIKLGAALPDTASEAMADYIGKQEGQMAGQRESNLNMALMQAGLGMMGSRARSGIQGVAEGGLEGLKSYRQGMSDIQKGEQQIELARMKMAEAKDARQRGLYDLAMKNEALSIDAYKLGQDAKAKGADILAKLGQTEAYEKVGQLRGRTADTIPSPAEVKSVREQVTQALTAKFLNSGQKYDPLILQNT
jgi:hypothetical protein